MVTAIAWKAIVRKHAQVRILSPPPSLARLFKVVVYSPQRDRFRTNKTKDRYCQSDFRVRYSEKGRGQFQRPLPIPQRKNSQFYCFSRAANLALFRGMPGRRGYLPFFNAHRKSGISRSPQNSGQTGRSCLDFLSAFQNNRAKRKDL